MEFKHFLQLTPIGLQARIPMHMTGFPGVGKTEFTKSLEAGFTGAGLKCKVIILVGSIREPQDFGGFPVSTPDGVRLLPMAWARDAQRLAQDGYLVVVFLDELTTVPPTTQAAMLRLLTENVCGELSLANYRPGTTSSPARRDDRGVREGGGPGCLDAAARRSGAAKRPVAVGPHLVSRVPTAGRNRSRVSGQPSASRPCTRRSCGRPGPAVSRVPRDVEPAGS